MALQLGRVATPRGVHRPERPWIAVPALSGGNCEHCGIHGASAWTLVALQLGRVATPEVSVTTDASWTTKHVGGATARSPPRRSRCQNCNWPACAHRSARASGSARRAHCSTSTSQYSCSSARLPASTAMACKPSAVLVDRPFKARSASSLYQWLSRRECARRRRVSCSCTCDTFRRGKVLAHQQPIKADEVKPNDQLGLEQPIDHGVNRRMSRRRSNRFL